MGAPGSIYSKAAGGTKHSRKGSVYDPYFLRRGSDIEKSTRLPLVLQPRCFMCRFPADGFTIPIARPIRAAMSRKVEVNKVNLEKMSRNKRSLRLRSIQARCF